MRDQTGPLTDTSAFPFEASFAHVKKSYQEGTTSMGKQCFQNLYLRLQEGDHRCKMAMRFRTKTTELTDDTMIYLYNAETGKHKFYKVKDTSMQETGYIECREIMTSQLIMYNMDLSDIGVYKKHLEYGPTITIDVKYIAGKAIDDGENLHTIPLNVLRDQ